MRTREVEDEMTEKCPECGGALVWEYRSGLVVCSSCGYVVDRIYDYGPLREDEDEIIWREIKTRRNPRRNPVKPQYRIHMRLYHQAYSYVKNKPWLEIDYDKVFETGRLINTIKSRATIDAERKISDRRLWRQVNKGIKYIEKTYPVALARSGRGKYALAYIVATYLEKGVYPSVKEVVDTFNISETSYRRLIKLAKEILSLKPLTTTH